MVVLGIADSNSFNRSRRGKGERERGGSQEASLLKVFVRRQRREVEGGEVEEALPSDPSLGADARDLRESVREDHRDVDHPRRRRGGWRWGLISHVARLVQGDPDFECSRGRLLSSRPLRPRRLSGGRASIGENEGGARE
ncbi:hypothetical protein GW17_00044141 [Ensete ventricosum]|nr:hypothetical protein GW17_00044141 [Ensete ventricosum]